MRQIRVLEIISGFAVEGPLGGIERFGIELAQSLDQEIIEPIVCGMWAYGTPYEHGWVNVLKERGIEAFIAADWEESAPYKSFIRAYKGTRSQIELPIDIIHSHCQFGDMLALLLKKQVGAKALVRTVHNEREWGKRPLRRLLLTNTLYPIKFDVEIGVAQQVVNNLDQRFLARLLKKRAVRGYNAINIRRFTNKQTNTANVRADLGLPASANIVGTIGRLTEQKGYAILLDAATLVLQKVPEVYFVIVGTGVLEQTLKEQANKLGIANRVVFTGSRNDVEELLHIFDVFVNSSLWEGLPTVIMESMAVGVPVIATEVGGNLELVQNQHNGILIPPHNTDKLAKAIIEVLTTDPTTLSTMVANAQLFVQKNFSITAVARQHDTLYQNLLA